VTIVLNGVAMWKQEARDRQRGNAPRGAEPGFAEAWARLSVRPGMMRLLVIIALGTAGFGMADVLMEPFGGQVLAMSVAETTRLTVFLALGSLAGFSLASAWIGRRRAIRSGCRWAHGGRCRPRRRGWRLPWGA